MDWIICLNAGAIAGLSAAMFGTGSGFVLIPCLTVALSYSSIGDADLVKIAIGSTHAANVVMSVSVIHAHTAKDNIDWLAFRRMTPGMAIGSAVGGVLSGVVDVTVMSLIFVALALFTAWRLRRGLNGAQPLLLRLPSMLNLSLKGSAIGVLGALAGSGGLTAPLLSRYLPMRRAIGTSAAMTLPLAAPAAITFAAMNTPASCGANCVGLVYIPAVCAAAMAAMMAAPFGAWLAHRLSVTLLKRSFANLLVAFALCVFLKTLPPVRGDGRALLASMLGFAAVQTLDQKDMPLWLRQPQH